MESKKAFEEMNKDSNITGKIVSWLLSILMVICIGMFGFLWQISKDMAVLKDHDAQRSNSIDKMQMDIDQLRSDMSELKLNNAMMTQQITELKTQINETKNKH